MTKTIKIDVLRTFESEEECSDENYSPGESRYWINSCYGWKDSSSETEDHSINIPFGDYISSLFSESGIGSEYRVVPGQTKIEWEFDGTFEPYRSWDELIKAEGAYPLPTEF